MPTFSRSSGVRLTTSDSITVGEISTDASVTRRGRSRRLFGPLPMPGATEGTSSERVDLLSALAAQEITIVDEVQLQPSLEAVPRTRRREGRPSESESATIELDLAGHEEAMVLLEQDGFYSWHLTPQIERVSASIVPRPAGFTRRQRKPRVSLLNSSASRKKRLHRNSEDSLKIS